MKQEKVYPVKVGEIIKLGITGIGAKGNPFGKIKGYIIFINNYENKAISLNQMLSVKITKVLEKFGFGELEEE